MGGRLVPARRWPCAPQKPQLESWAVGVLGALLGGLRASPGALGLPRCAVYPLGLVGPTVIPCEVWTGLEDQKELRDVQLDTYVQVCNDRSRDV